MSHGGIQQLHSQPDLVASCTVHTVEDLLEEEARRANGGSSKTDRNISAREYYAYKLQCRPNNLLLRGGRCFQQYIVDMYVKVENTRSLSRNPSTIDCGEKCAANVGRKVILPPTFIGGPRDLTKRYLNAMALVQRFGKPDLFITMTCNANWSEIKKELAVGEKAQDISDIVARIFRAQKRGLPHAHFLVILKQEYKIKWPFDFDKFVCAKIPSVDNSYLRKVILKHMMHGPCGHLDPECPCMKHRESPGRCKYGYPKQLCDETKNSSDGYPLYRRRGTGETVTVRRTIMDNKWVIPYNPYLSSYSDCHLNVEVCSTIEAVTYLYKYVYEGHDRVSFNIVRSEENVPVQNEIQQYQSDRWVSPCEAAWRLFGFDMYEMHPPVLPLPVHFPYSQLVQLRPNERLRSVVSDDKCSRTCLTEFFRMNVKLSPGTRLKYNEFSKHYRWDASEKRCPKSFEDLRTVDGHVCDTFQQAGLKLNLLEEDDSVDLCLREGCVVQMPLAIRKLFATVLIFCHPSNPLTL
ncbi:uncharacterized protein LOC110699144 [Chenopodium quinoa]|uniref:uncharacterized protein LOC110699144 n=1 Tax=Chenopodium quinoa TaxID=63459 RepID=UPI000B77DEBB|nr:uncharacterized protein LOC110699144 [Chenopodium quinoa]